MIYAGGDVGIAFAYYSYKEETEQTALKIVASVAKQFAARYPEEVEHLKGNLPLGRPDLKHLKALLLSLLSKYSQVFILVDALDECEKGERGLLISTLCALQSLCATRIRILITGRPHVQNIQPLLGNVFELEIKANASDLEAYVRNTVTNDQDLMTIISGEPEMVGTIVSIISKQASGM